MTEHECPDAVRTRNGVYNECQKKNNQFIGYMNFDQ